MTRATAIVVSSAPTMLMNISMPYHRKFLATVFVLLIVAELVSGIAHYSVIAHLACRRLFELDKKPFFVWAYVY
jgi:hypothetical protein